MQTIYVSTKCISHRLIWQCIRLNSLSDFSSANVQSSAALSHCSPQGTVAAVSLLPHQRILLVVKEDICTTMRFSKTKPIRGRIVDMGVTYIWAILLKSCHVVFNAQVSGMAMNKSVQMIFFWSDVAIHCDFGYWTCWQRLISLLLVSVVVEEVFIYCHFPFSWVMSLSLKSCFWVYLRFRRTEIMYVMQMRLKRCNWIMESLVHIDVDKYSFFAVDCKGV